MNRKSLTKEILLQKIMLNFLLKFLYLTNFFIVYKNQNLDNQIGEPDTQTKDDPQEIQTENNQEQDDSNNNQQEALENEGEENDN